MAVKARDQVTVVDLTDVQSVTIYYLLQLSTLSVPSRPTSINPSNWSTTEPAFTSGTTNTLYTCVRTLYKNGTYAWGEVNVSSSYEAAKAAWNKAQAAQDTADSIDLTGLVKFTDLSTAGSTEINGGNITTGSIDAGLITTGKITAVDIEGVNINGCILLSLDNNNVGTVISGGRISFGTAEMHDFAEIGSIQADYSGDTHGNFVFDSFASDTKMIIKDFGGIELYVKDPYTGNPINSIVLSNDGNVSINGLNFNDLGRHFSTWQDFGRILTGSYNFHYYANLVMTVLSPNHVALHMTGKMGTNYNSSSYYQYGISISKLTSFISTQLATLGLNVASVSYEGKSPWLAWEEDNGTLRYNLMDYGTCFEVDVGGGVLRPARVYNTYGAIGGWGIGSIALPATYFETTIYANITLA